MQLNTSSNFGNMFASASVGAYRYRLNVKAKTLSMQKALEEQQNQINAINESLQVNLQLTESLSSTLFDRRYKTDTFRASVTEEQKQLYSRSLQQSELLSQSLNTNINKHQLMTNKTNMYIASKGLISGRQALNKEIKKLGGRL